MGLLPLDPVDALGDPVPLLLGRAELLPDELKAPTDHDAPAPPPERLDRGLSGRVSLKELVKETTAQVERRLIVQALEQTGGNVTRAAQLLMISRKSLQNKMKEFSLRDEE